ncbi:hypothetical protein EV426DRAFT_29329 [Tirmania nivea]|nr:hypothetical protein EV426DRAFT_29329 [Tirmania nivea]
MKYFWPLGMTSYYVDFPGEFEEEDWERRLFKFIDDMERKHQMWQSTGFNATNITIGDYEIESESTLVSVTDVISAYIPRKGAHRPVWIDVKACNIEVVDIYSPYTQEDDPTQVEEDKLVDLQITLVDYHAEGYLFLKSSELCKAPDKIAFTVKDINGDHYADTIEKARNLARFVTRRPAPGQPLSDLELPAGPHRSYNDAQAALEKRREAITSMADSPMVDRINFNQKAEGVKDSCVHQVEDNDISRLGSPPRDPQSGVLAPRTNVSSLLHSVEAVSGALNRPKSTVTAGASEMVNVCTIPLVVNAFMEKKEILSTFTTASTTPGNLAHPPTNQKKRLYESDSELSELSEPPEELEPIISLPMVNTDTQKKSGLAVPRFKKAEKVTEQGTNGSVQGELPTTSGKKQTWLITNENGGSTILQLKGIKDASSKKEGLVGDQVLPGRESMFQKSQVPKATLNEITTTATGGTVDKVQQKPSRTIDSGVDIPTSLEKPSTFTKTLLKKTIAKPMTQPSKKKTATVVRNSLNASKQVKVPIKVHYSNGKSLDIYELPSDGEDHYILPVKGKGGKIKQDPVPVKGKGKTTARKPAAVKSAQGAKKHDTEKLDEQHRNKAGVLPSGILEVPLAKEVTKEANAVPSVPTAIKPARKISGISKESKNVQGKKPQRVSNEAMKHGINEDLHVELLVHKIQEDREHETTVQRSKVKAAPKLSIQETGIAPQDIRVFKRVAPDTSKKNPAKEVSSKVEARHEGKVEIPAFEVQISSISCDVVSVQCNVPRAYETGNAKHTEALGEAKIPKGKLISILPDNIQEDTGKKIKEAEVENATDNALLSESNAINGHALKPTPSGRIKLTTSGVIDRSGKAPTALKRKAKVSEVGPSNKRLKGLLLLNGEPVQPGVRTRRAAANIALAKLRLQDIDSSQSQDEEESTGAVNKPQERVLGRCMSIESPHEENRPSPPPQRKIPDVQELKDGDFPDLGHHSHLIELIAEQQHDKMRTSDIPMEPRIVKPKTLAAATEKLKPSAIVGETQFDVRGDGLRALLSGPKGMEVVGSVEAAGASTVKNCPGNQPSWHAANKPGLNSATIAVKVGDDALSDDIVQVAPDKPTNEIGIGKRRRTVRQSMASPSHSIASVGLLRKQPTREPQVSDKGNKTSRTKLHTGLDLKTPDVSLGNLLSRKPQIISWGKQGPLNQGRLIDTSGARGHRGLNITLTKAELVQHEEENSPSQRIRTKRKEIGATLPGETRPGNTEYRSPPVDSLLFLRHKAALLDANSKEILKSPPSVLKVNTHDMLQGEDQGVQSYVSVSFSDLPEKELGRQRDELEEMDHESLLAHILDNEHLDSVIQVSGAKVEEHMPQPSSHDFIPSECDIIKKNRVPLPKTPEGKRTDFWNEPGYTGIIDIGFEETTNVEGLFNQLAPIPSKPPKPRMKQMVLSADIPPVLIKQSGKRIESATVDDPFKGYKCKAPLP